MHINHYDLSMAMNDVSNANQKLERLEKRVETLERILAAHPERKTFHVIDKTTGKEADPYEIALNEDWAKSLCYCDMEGFAILEDGTLILADECGRFEFIQENDRFEIVWDEVNNDQ